MQVDKMLRNAVAPYNAATYTFLLLCLFATAGWSDDGPGIDTTGYASIDARGAGLFSIPIPGETYDPLAGRIGHVVNDMVVTGNGDLPIVLQRKFEGIPKAYPHAFGNMSLTIPRLYIDRINPDPAFQFSPSLEALDCNVWDDGNQPAPAAWNDVKFYHTGGMVSLVDKRFLTTSMKSQFPAHARFISADNWYLTCNGANNTGDGFEVHSPDGTVYLLQSQERIHAKRPDDHTNQYTVFVNVIEKHGSKIEFYYEVSPEIDPKAYPPMFIGGFLEGTGNGQVDRNHIRGKIRVKQMKGFYRPENGSNTWALDRTVDIAYRSANETTCPNLISSIASSAATNTNLIYSYLHFVDTSTNFDVDQCLLDRVTQADGSYWEFEYGYDAAHPFMPGGSFPDEAYAQLHIPLHKVTIPTGATVEYLHHQLGVCEYQNAYSEALGPNDNYPYNTGTGWHQACTDDEQLRGPGLYKRTVTGSDIPTTVTNIGYEHPSPNPDHLVNRIIDNPVRRHYLTFGRIERHETVNGPASGNVRILRSGRLINQKTYALGGGTVGGLLSQVDFDYQENGNGFINYNTFVHPDPSEDNYQTKASRFKFLYDALRVNPKTTTTHYNGDAFKVVRRSYDTFNFPTRIDEIHDPAGGGSTLSRTTAVNYDHGTVANRLIGKVVYRGTGTTVNNEPSSLDLATEHRSYDNATGRLTTETVNGFQTQFLYWPSGDLRRVTDGNFNTTNYSLYKQGVARRETNAVNGITTRTVDPDGLVTKIVDAEGNVENYRYSAMGLQTQYWPGNQSGHRTYSILPVWHNASSPHFRRSRDYQPGRWHKWTWLDVLGRPKTSQQRSDINGFKRIWAHQTYDNMGRTGFISDPKSVHNAANAAWTGTSYFYDHFDRLVRRKHSSGADDWKYCYGPPCNNLIYQIPGVTVKHGYVARSPSGHNTAYNHVAYGHPSKQQITGIHQQITASTRVDTTLERNVHGFIEKVTQDGVDRTYTPHTRTFPPNSGSQSLTLLVEEEKHPDFDGTRKVTLFDGVGNPLSIRNYDNSVLNYQYSPLNLVSSVSSSNGNYGVSYQYYNNGQVKDATAQNATWTYTYLPNRPLLQSETLAIDGQSFSLNYAYDDYGAITNMSYPSGLSLAYLQNAFGQIETIDFNSGNGAKPLVLNATYHANGQLNTASLSNGQAFTSHQNDRGLPTAWGTNKAGTVSDTMDLLYHYDNRNNVTQINNYFAPFSTHLHALQYDGLNRLKEAKGHWGTANYSYDALSNIESINYSGLDNYTLDHVYQTNRNRLTAVNTTDAPAAPGRSFIYDANGNVIYNGSKNFTYDALNQLVTASEGGQTLTNLYDANHHRQKASLSEGGQTQTTYYLYSAGSLLYEYDLETGEERNHIFLDGQSLATLGTHNHTDADGDGIPDFYERLHGLNPEDALDSMGDEDGDGISNRNEYELGGLAMSIDGDNDGLPDSWEREYFLDTGVSDAMTADADNDGVSNFGEYQAGTNPSDHLMPYSEQMFLVPVMHGHSY